MKQFSSAIFIAVFSFQAMATQNPLSVELGHQLTAFNDIVSTQESDAGRDVASGKVDYQERVASLSSISQYIQPEGQKEYWEYDHKKTKGEEAKIKAILVGSFKYFLPLYEAELSANEDDVSVDQVQYRHILKEILIKGAQANLKQAKAFMATRSAAEVSGAAEVEAEILRVVCLKNDKQCSKLKVEASSGRSVASVNGQSFDVADVYSYAELAALPADRVTEKLVSLKDAEQFALNGISRSVAAESDAEH